MASTSSSAAPELANADADGLVGMVVDWPSHTLPGPKWLFCDGAAVSRATYSLLFSRIGEEHGVGDGSTTFNLPNRTGKFPVGYDAADTDFDNIGDTGGTKSVTSGSGGVHNHGTVTGGAPAGGSAFLQSLNDSSSHTHSVATVPPFAVTRYIVKVL